MPQCSFTNCLKASVTYHDGARLHGSYCADHDDLAKVNPHAGPSTEIDRYGDALVVFPVAP